VWFHDVDSLRSMELFRMRGDRGTFVERIQLESTSTHSGNVQKERENAITSTVSAGDQIIAINGLDVSTMSLEDIESFLKDPPPLTEAKRDDESHDHNLNVLQLPDSTEPSMSSSANYSVSGDASDRDDSALSALSNTSKPAKRAKALMRRSTKNKLMSFMKLNKEQKAKTEGPIRVTFRRVILCPYFSPLILYREIKKAIQNHALSLHSLQLSVHSDVADKSYRKQRPKGNQADLQELLQQSGIAAITSVEFRAEHFILFWNLAWHFSNLRLPIHFLRSAFEDEKEMVTPDIDDLIHFVPLDSAHK